jgi:excisionase family DNA binding protein
MSNAAKAKPHETAATGGSAVIPALELSQSALLTPGDVAKLLNVSAAWVRDHATRKQPRLPVVRVGKLLRFRPHEIEEWIQEQSRRTW